MNKYCFRNLLLLFSTVFFLIKPEVVSSQNVLTAIQETGNLKVAVREDAPPFAYLDSAKKLQGYCLDFLALVKEELARKLQKDAISITLWKSNIADRFQLVKMGIADLECGPNTIRELSSDEVAFSQEFFITGTQFLINKSKRKLFDLGSDLEGLSLGVIKGTSTEEFLRKNYPQAKLKLFSGVVARRRGVQAVKQGRIDAMVSEGILLRGEANLQNIPRERYILIPKTPVTCDRYGLIIRGQDRQWRDFINSVIASKEARDLFNFDSHNKKNIQKSDC